MFQSNNPVLTRSESFNGRSGGYAPQGAPSQYGHPGQQFTPYDPQQSQGQYGPAQYGPGGVAPQGVMTLDDVITKTAMVMGVLVAVATISWLFIPIELTTPVLIVSALVGFVTVLLVTLRRKVNATTSLIYAAIEGVFIGMFSRMFEMFYPGIVVQAVLATFVVVGVLLAAYKFGGFRLSSRVKKITVVATIAFAGVMLLNFVLALAGINLGLRAGMTGPVSLLAIGVSLLAVVLAALNLIMDFDMVENGIRNRAPASESWVAAFGLTVTMVWLYTELLRIISYFRR